MSEPKTDLNTAAPPPEPLKMMESQVIVPAEKKPEPPKTPGEKFYDVFQFFAGKIFIIAVTALLAFAADQKYAPEKIAGVPNFLKKFQGWFHKVIFHNKIYPVAEKGDVAKLIGGGLVGTMILSHGGNFFAPFIRWLENEREKISNAYNKRFGTPEDVEIAHDRLKDIPKQNWGDVAKGRVAAWGTVLATMVGAYKIAGKQKSSGRYWLDIYEDAFARKLSWLSKTGKEIAATPVAKALTEAQASHSTYRFGKVLALDLYATSAGIVIWNFFSRMSAKKRTLKEQIKMEEKEPEEFILPVREKELKDSPESHFASKMNKPESFAQAVQQSVQEPAIGASI